MNGKVEIYNDGVIRVYHDPYDDPGNNTIEFIKRRIEIYVKPEEIQPLFMALKSMIK